MVPSEYVACEILREMIFAARSRTAADVFAWCTSSPTYFV
jgi:hypothetical protein